MGDICSVLCRGLKIHRPEREFVCVCVCVCVRVQTTINVKHLKLTARFFLMP